MDKIQNKSFIGAGREGNRPYVYIAEGRGRTIREGDPEYQEAYDKVKAAERSEPVRPRAGFEGFDGFKYAKPDAPTASGLYWPQMKHTMWSYCYYLGSWANSRGKYDLGVHPTSHLKAYQDRPVSDATVDCPNNYHSGEIIISSFSRWGGDGHYSEVLARALNHGFKVRAWHDGPVVVIPTTQQQQHKHKE